MTRSVVFYRLKEGTLGTNGITKRTCLYRFHHKIQKVSVYYSSERLKESRKIFRVRSLRGGVLVRRQDTFQVRCTSPVRIDETN